MRVREIKEKDADGMLEWIKDPKTSRWSRIDTENQTKQSVQEFIKNSYIDTETFIHRAIVDDDDNYLGTVSLKNIDMELLSAEYAISLRICAQGTGAAQFGTKEILKIAFEDLSLERVYWYVFSDNERANGYYKKIGATLEGEFRKSMKVKGIFHNVKWYSVLKEEYWAFANLK